MLRLQPVHERDTVWNVLLPVGLVILPPDLARVDELLSDPALLAPFRTLWRERDAAAGRQAESFGRPTIAMATYVRLMVLKSRTGSGLCDPGPGGLLIRSTCGASASSR